MFTERPEERKEREEREERYEELYQKAVNRYLDKTDWDMSEWLEPEEWEEFKQLSDED